MSLKNRLNQSHHIEEEPYKSTVHPPPVMPQPILPLYVKLIAVKGLELHRLRISPGSPSFDHPLSPDHDIRPRTATIGYIGVAKNL